MRNTEILPEPSNWDLVWSGDIARIERPHEPGEPRWLTEVQLFDESFRFGPFANVQYKDYIRLLRALKLRRVLIGGSGVSLYGEILAHCGLDVTDVDFSSVAMEYARRHPASDFDWFRFHKWPGPCPDRFFRLYPEALDKARAVKARWHRKGGRLEQVVADLRTMAWDTFDAVILRRTLDLVGPDNRRRVLKLCFRHLTPGGILFAEGFANHLIGDNEDQAEPETTLEEIVRELGFTVFNEFGGEWNVHQTKAPVTKGPDGRLRGWWGDIADASQRGERVAVLGRPC